MDMQRFYDAIIVGGGPAGLTAAIYLARARYRVLVIEKDTFGGQITITSEVVNYPGVFKTSGKELTESMRRQGEAFGAEFLKAEVTGIRPDGEIKTVSTSVGDYSCYGILLATGAHPRMLGFPGEAEFKGHGVAYCATCDGEFFTGKEVFVIGGGFAAAEESVFLTKYASHVTILIRGDGFKCAETTANAALQHPQITVLTNTEVVEATGGDQLERLIYRNKKTGEVTTFAPENDTFGIFVFAGYEPASELVKDLVELTPQGYIVTDNTQQTSVEGIYAAGDICVKDLRQVVTAVGDGATAATAIEKYAAAMQKRTGLIPEKLQAAVAGANVAGGNAATGANAGTGASVSSGAADAGAVSGSGYFDAGMVAQLNTVFGRMAAPLILELHLDAQPLSRELRQYIGELAGLTDKLTVREAATSDAAELPCVRVLRSDGTETGLAFHGVPGGHEFTSFVLGLYNAAGPGQPVDPALLQRAQSIDHPVDMRILVSLSCTMCPELVIAAQRIAAVNPAVTAEVYDLQHYPALREQYKVMSVPCLIVDKDGAETVSFGKKNLEQLLEMM